MRIKKEALLAEFIGRLREMEDSEALGALRTPIAPEPKKPEVQMSAKANDERGEKKAKAKKKGKAKAEAGA